MGVWVLGRGFPIGRFGWVVVAVVCVVVGWSPGVVFGAGGHRRHGGRFTGFRVAGRTSTFGWPLEFGASGGVTADGGSTRERPCIALRSSASMDHAFSLVLWTHERFHVKRWATVVLQCDWGPASWTGRAIDVTGAAVFRLGLSPWSFPTGAWGLVRELRRVPVPLRQYCRWRCR